MEAFKKILQENTENVNVYFINSEYLKYRYAEYINISKSIYIFRNEKPRYLKEVIFLFHELGHLARRKDDYESIKGLKYNDLHNQQKIKILEEEFFAWIFCFKKIYDIKVSLLYKFILFIFSSYYFFFSMTSYLFYVLELLFGVR